MKQHKPFRRLLAFLPWLLLVCLLVSCGTASPANQPQQSPHIDTDAPYGFDAKWTSFTDPINGRNFHCLTQQTGAYSATMWCYEVGL